MWVILYSISTAVLDNRNQFIHIDHLVGPLPFFTYGPYHGYMRPESRRNVDTSPPSSVLTSSQCTYAETMDVQRMRMSEQFGWVYERVRMAVAMELNTSESHVEVS